MNRLSAPLDVQLEITSLCNEKCRHCYNYWRYTPEQTTNKLGVDGFTEIILQINNAKVGQVTFTGGEPIIREDVLFRLVQFAHSLGIDVGLNSNAVLIDRDCAHELATSGLDHALISLLGTENTHDTISGSEGNFKKTCIGIQNLIEYGIPVSASMVVSKLNISEIFNTAKVAKRLGVRGFCAGPAIPACKPNIPICLSPEECKQCLKELMRVSEELSMDIDVLEPLPRCMFNVEEEIGYVRFFGNRICSAAVSSCAISSAGDMRPCIHADI